MHQMVVRLVLRFIAITAALLYVGTSTVFAQTFFGPGSKKKEDTQTKQPAQSQVMSSDEFKNAVSNLNQQTKDNLTQQLNQQLAKQPPLLPSSLPNPTEVTPPANQNIPIPTPVPVPSGAPAMQIPPAATAPVPSETPAIQTPPPASAPAPSYSTRPSQGETYTGFGTGKSSTGTTTPSPSSGNSGGWNIKY